MTAYVALLRAVNVGGTGKLLMTELKTMCNAAGLQKVSTYIASGNVVFESDFPEAKVKAALETAMETYAGKPVGVMVRTATQIAAVKAANPFTGAALNRVMAIFLDAPPPSDALKAARHVDTEEMALGVREIYVHYPWGQADTKLVIPAAKTGTARNLNTIGKLAEMAAAL